MYLCSMCSFISGAASHDLSLSPSQGLPGPPGEKGENGDVGPMVSFPCPSNSNCFHVNPSEVGNCADCSEVLAGG